MYSMDTEVNKRNPYTPSTLSLEEQLLYRLGSLESTLEGHFRLLDEKFESLFRDTASRREELARELMIFKTETNRKEGVAEARITAVEKWQTAMAVRFSVAAAIIVVLWTVFGGAIRQAIGVPA